MSDEPHDLPRWTVLGAFWTVAVTAGRGKDGGCPRADHLGAPAPGPDLLYEDPVSAAKLSPGDGWDAEPLLVSGGEAYVNGEYLYWGWVHDDYGATTLEETGTESPMETGIESPVETSLDQPEGDLVYPTDAERYRYNSADILEVRVRRTRDGVAYRIALNTMVEGNEDAAAVASGIDTDDGDRTDWGHGLGDLGDPGDTVVVVAGEEAMVDGEGAVESVEADAERNHLEVDLSLEPGKATWTHYAVAGMQDGDLGFAPVQPQPMETEPGGAAISDVPPVFDVAFRTHEDEPLRDPATGLGVSWREYAQSQALADRDISQFGVDIDFETLRDGVTERNIPKHGFVNRLFASRAEFGEETAYDEGVDPASRPLLLGDVQPYAIYVPESYDQDGPEPTPLVVMPHSLGQNYN